MKIFLFDKLGNYTRQLDAREDPLEPGRYLMPKNSTATVPHADVQRRSKYGKWDGKKWDSLPRKIEKVKKDKKDKKEKEK